MAPLSCKTFGERVVEQRIMARRFSGSIYRHPASSIGNVRNQRLRHGAFLSWTLNVNGGRVEKIEAPKGAELEPVFTHLRPNLEIRVSLSWVISGCFIEDVVEADLPDSSFARGKPSTFGVGQVIKGWGEGVQLMVVGEKRRLWIP